MMCHWQERRVFGLQKMNNGEGKTGGHLFVQQLPQMLRASG